MSESKRVVEKLLLKDLGVELPKELDPLMGVNELSVGGSNDGMTPLFMAMNLAFNFKDWNLLNALIDTRELENGCDLSLGFNLCNDDNTPILRIFSRVMQGGSDPNDAFCKALRIFTTFPGIYTSLRGVARPGCAPGRFQLPLTYLFGNNQKLKRLLEEKPLETMADVLPCVNLAEKILISGLVPNYIKAAIYFLSHETSIFPQGISMLMSEYLYDLEGLKRCQDPVGSDQFSHNLFKLALSCFIRDMDCENQSIIEHRPSGTPSQGNTSDKQQRRINELESQVQILQKQIHLMEQQMKEMKQRLGDKPSSDYLTFSFNSSAASVTSIPGLTAEDFENDSLTHQFGRPALRLCSKGSV